MQDWCINGLKTHTKSFGEWFPRLWRRLRRPQLHGVQVDQGVGTQQKVQSEDAIHRDAIVHCADLDCERGDDQSADLQRLNRLFNHRFIPANTA